MTTLEAAKEARTQPTVQHGLWPALQENRASSEVTSSGHEVQEEQVYPKTLQPADVLSEAREAVNELQVERVKHFYLVPIPLTCKFKALGFGDEHVAIHDDEKAAVFMNYLRFNPGFTTLLELLYADNYDLIAWSDFRYDKHDVYTMERVYLEITGAVNKARLKYNNDYN